jgi:hypothetical protein
METVSTIQLMQKEITELHKIVKQQTEKIMYNETIMAQLVNHVQYSRTQSSDDDEDYEDEDEEDEEDEEDDDDDDDYECDKNNCVNRRYESRLDDLEKFVLNLEQKILELEKRQKQ